MAGVRDPAFWKRFSVAVHLDEETGDQRRQIKHSDSWLARQNAKSNHYRICWIFWPCAFILVAAVIAIVIWLLRSGALNNVKIGDGNGTPSPPADPNAGVQKRWQA